MTSVSAIARRARWIASSRVAPVMITFASIESNAPEMTSPALTPESTRTPGPPGQRSVLIVPGEGRKLRCGSSPFIRNSIE